MSRSNPEDPNALPILLLGNKIDLEKDGERQVLTQQGVQYSKEHHNMLFYETSAKDAVNVEKGFNELARKAIEI